MFRVVIVEDEPPILRSIKEKIVSIDSDFKVVGEYYNGAAALLELDIVKPHVLITDLHMPVMDGETLLGRVRELYPDMLCVIVSGYQQFEYALMAVRKGIVDYLVKPPTEASIAKLLADLKVRLLQSRTLVEAAILQRLVLPHSPVAGPDDADLGRYAQEYFYHASYLLLYAWLPAELELEPPAAALRSTAEGWLREGERCYPIASPGHECILLLGVHELREERMAACRDGLLALDGADSVAVVALPVAGGIGRLPDLLLQARKAAVQISRLRGLAFAAVAPGQAPEEAEPAGLPAADVSHLAAFVRKQKKQEFARALAAALPPGELGARPRTAWIKALQRLVRALEPHVPFAAPEGVFARMEDELAQAMWSTRDPEVARGHLQRIFGRLFEEDDAAGAAGWPEAVEAYLQANFTANIALSDLAERFGLNPSYLSFVFKSRKGRSPGEHLIELRVEEAKRLIREHPRLLFKDIAEQVGYPDPYYFSKLFKQWVGLTPTEYKRGQRFD